MILEWLHIASRRPIVMRGVKYAIVVGSILIIINHGNAIAAGTVDSTRMVQMILTLLVPYCVSTASSVGAIIDHRAGKTDP
ncbi:MAG: nitrate/nitrite transporter NrtS [Gemmatimonadetes bacterium]|nr:nitrate/nitrite transporter NrtS [Gemmatimonadota bacterium]